MVDAITKRHKEKTTVEEKTVFKEKNTMWHGEDQINMVHKITLVKR